MLWENQTINTDTLSDSSIFLTQAEFYVMFDTLMGSLGIADGGTHFRFTKDVRHKTVSVLLERMNNIKAEIK